MVKWDYLLSSRPFINVFEGIRLCYGPSPTLGSELDVYKFLFLVAMIMVNIVVEVSFPFSVFIHQNTTASLKLTTTMAKKLKYSRYYSKNFTLLNHY